MANFCGKCGAKLEEGNGFCTNCGQPVKTDVSPVNVNVRPANVDVSPVVAGENFEAKPTRKKWLVPVIAGVAVLLALGLGIATTLFFLVKGNFEAKKEFTDKVDLGNGVTLEMVKIPAGSFVREDGRAVKLTKDFWLGKYEVRQAEYEALMGKNPSNFKGGNLPVECVSWHDAQKFCDKLNEKYRDRLPAGYKFALPTEAQWEYACRAGTTTNFSYGNASDTGKMNFNGNYPDGGGDKGIYRESTVPVGSLGYKNDFGLYDMHGNVWEWCADWYGAYTADTTDPVGPTSGSNRVGRGGGWCDIARGCRSACRGTFKPGSRDSIFGFRVALVPVQ